MPQLYAFAFFIFILVCALALLCRHLFADVKRLNKLLDEKESKLLRLYETVEDSMDEFFDQVTEAKSEIKLLRETSRLPPPPAAPRLAAKPRKKSAEQPEFRHYVDELIDEEPDIESFADAKQEPEKEEKHPRAAAGSRGAAVMELYAAGMDKTRIAEELGITKTEVELVLGLKGNLPQ